MYKRQAEGGSILFVGTKKQAQDAIKVEAERCGMYYVNKRWLGGMLTHFKTIKSRIARLKNIIALILSADEPTKHVRRRGGFPAAFILSGSV